VAAIVSDYRRHALKAVGSFQWAARKQARASALIAAQRCIAQLQFERERQWRQAQQELDRWWAALLRNEPDAVLTALAEAFEDNEAPAAAVGVDGSEVAIVALVPGIETMPERKPDTTAAGNLTLKKLTKSERASLHTTAVASHVLLTLREAFAVAPGLSAARIIAVQQAGDDAYGKGRLDAILAARFERATIDRVRWEQASATGIVDDASTELLLNPRRATGELRPLDVQNEPGLAALLDQIEPDDLERPGPATAHQPLGESPEEQTRPLSLYDGKSSSNRTLVIRAGVAAAWLLLLVIAAVDGVSGLLIVLGLPLLGIGIAAVMVGHARWAWLANRQTSAAALVAGFVLTIAGGAMTPAAPTPTGAQPTQSTSAAASTTESTTTTLTTPPPTTTLPAPPVTAAQPVPTQAPAPQPPAPKTSNRPAPTRTTAPAPPPPPKNCDPAYPTVCIPPPPPDLDCGQIPYRNFVVLAPDPHRFDGSDNDGIGCES